LLIAVFGGSSRKAAPREYLGRLCAIARRSVGGEPGAL
jgi:hypothetical protein